MSDNYVNIDKENVILREDNSIEWEDDDVVCLKRIKADDEKLKKKRVERKDTKEESEKKGESLIEKAANMQSSDTESVAEMSLPEVRKLREINRKLMTQPEGIAFNVPVDPDALQIPTYFSVIKSPMDLGTIKKNLSDKKYLTKEEFYKDVKLTFNNAKVFNHPDSDVYKWAVKLDKMFDGFWKLAFDDKKVVVEKKMVETPHEQARSIAKESTGTSRNKSRSKKINPDKPLTFEEKKKLAEDLQHISKDKEKLDEVLAVLDLAKTGKSKVSIKLNNLSTTQQRELQRIMKGKGRKEQNTKMTMEERKQQASERLEKLQPQTEQKKVQPKAGKKHDSDSESENELSSSDSIDSEEANLIRMSKTK
ncbi:bromodomain containing protein, putative [Entamoeba invadens IP1]|uniref:Bromodomain containing protein, putative n=1 Tax=Entamoeba invadens IP1 TaxID=370355 RepID=A0A0A1U4Y2_ENTIV|nr:bromodomain containing protein, putative [Entamoeba invadens IP1]ELP87938.1 bromodomain containing protein, putative [Entamoeba invadens IP1]|eukprot:XP_004254709.1 bromodomain containing protein, putative [Entamoeba invadens IP1]